MRLRALLPTCGRCVRDRLHTCDKTLRNSSERSEKIWPRDFMSQLRKSWGRYEKGTFCVSSFFRRWWTGRQWWWKWLPFHTSQPQSIASATKKKRSICGWMRKASRFCLQRWWIQHPYGVANNEARTSASEKDFTPPFLSTCCLGRFSSKTWRAECLFRECCGLAKFCLGNYKGEKRMFSQKGSGAIFFRPLDFEHRSGRRLRSRFKRWSHRQVFVRTYTTGVFPCNGWYVRICCSLRSRRNRVLGQ